jgi:peptidoglycan/LPS O-acetylase OafA/YrhL
MKKLRLLARPYWAILTWFKYVSAELPLMQNESTCGEKPPRGTSVQNPEGGPRSPRYDSLTLWRGFACLLVIVYHSSRGPLHEVNGFTALIFQILGRFWIGVPLFFVISGYCVTASADALRRRDGSARHFFWRRFLRIYPPYWAVIAITALGVCLMNSYVSEGAFQALMMPLPQWLTKWQWLGNLTLTEGWRWHLTRGVEDVFLPPSWTLCYEEQFYFLVGLVLILTRRFFFFALGFLTLIVAILFLFPWPGLYTTGLFLDGRWLMLCYKLCPPAMVDLV